MDRFSLETLQFSSVQSSSVQLFNKTMEQGHWGAPGSAKEAQGTPATGQLPLFRHSKHTSESKMPYIYLKKHPIKIITLDLPDQTHLGAKKPYSYLKRHPIKLSTFVLPHQPRSSRHRIPHLAAKCHFKPYSSVQFSPVQSSCSIKRGAGKTREQLGATQDTGERQGVPKSPKEPQ